LKKILVLFAIFSTALVLASCEQGPDLIIYQNKVEIDAELSAYAKAWGEKNGYVVEVQTCGGDACAYGTQLLAQFQGSRQPDIFVIEGLGGFNQYKDKIYQFSGSEAWIANTSLEFVNDSKVYGFPVAIEGWGMAYNEDILKAAGVTIPAIGAPLSQAEFRAMFEKVQTYYTTSNITGKSVVSMAAAAGMTLVTGLHNFNGYLSAGLSYTDTTVIDQVNRGLLNEARFASYVDWVELLFEFSNKTVLTTGGYDEQVGLFASGNAAFLHQGNWTDSSYTNSTFKMGYLPHGVLATGNDSIFIGAPSYYVINNDADDERITAAKKFLEDLAATAEGHDYMVNKANMVPAFDSVTLVPKTPLSAAVLAWNQAGKAYAWFQNDLPAGFGMSTLGPIYEALAKGDITRAQFINQVRTAVSALGA
jgi:raffinose/stachyose/melibiose transport system substrate-binding protein